MLCRYKLHPTHSQGIGINYKNDFIPTGCCQGKTEHPLSIPAALERVLFVGRRLDFQWEVLFFATPTPADRISTEQPPTRLSIGSLTRKKSLVGYVLHFYLLNYSQKIIKLKNESFEVA